MIPKKKIAVLTCILFASWVAVIESQTGATCTITNCDKCVNAPLKCLKCMKSYYYSNTTMSCKSCGSNCKECNLKNSCSKCASKYFFDKKMCSSCLPGCTTCADKLTCDTCEPGKYKVTSGVKCFSCSSYCTKCKSSSNCLSCTDGYYLTASACTVCPSNCLICSAGKSCATCKTGYHWNSVTSVCSSCGPYCIAGSCDQSSGCTKCMSGYLKDNKTCRKCLTLAASNCASCLTASFGHYWATNVCTQCITNCLGCTSLTTCGGALADNCLIDYAFDSVNTVCSACSSYSTSQAGLTTQASCHKCKGLYWSVSCSACDATTLLTTSVKCQRCADSAGSYAVTGVFISNQKCKTIDCTTYAANLASITDAGECNFCDGYYLTGGTCTATTAANDCTITAAATINAFSTDVCNGCENRFWFTLGATCTKPATCTGNTWTQLMAKHCGHYWNAVGSTCDAIDCDTLSALNSLAKCKGCLNRYWDAATNTCKVINCYDATLLTTQEKCEGCSKLGHKWSGGACSLNAQCTAASLIANCVSCDGWFWDAAATPPVCTAIACGAATTQQICEGCFGSAWVGGVFHAIKCLPASTADDCYGLTDGTNLLEYNATPLNSITQLLVQGGRFANYIWSGGAGVFDSTLCPAATTNSPHIDTCTCMSTQFSATPQCQLLTTNDLTTINALTNIHLKKATTDHYASLKKSIHYDAATAAAMASACTTLSSITTQAECESCPAANWDTNITGANKCKATICTIQPLNDAHKCNGCTSKVFVSNVALSDCYKCPANSISCTVTSAVCKQGYVWDRDTWSCISATCNTSSDQVNCNQCAKMVWDTTCKACPLNCKACSSSTVCTSCIDDYLWDSTETACVLCYSKEKAICDQCSTTLVGKYFVTATTLCLPCAALTMATITTTEICTTCGKIIGSKPTFWDDTATQKCGQCLTNCDVCTDALSCTTCAVSKYFTAGTGTNAGTCNACMSNCVKCADGVSCTKCSDSYYYNSVDPKSCNNCPSNCLLCSADKTCDKCVANMYADPTTGACATCMSNCATCDTSTMCIKCNSGFFKNTAVTPLSCDVCPTSCAFCESATVCITCNSGFCLNQNKQCTSTTNNCKKCNADSSTPPIVTCIDCIANHELEVCLGCSKYCTDCNDSKKCTKCNQGYYLNVDKCSACGTNCKICNTGDSCNECNNLTMFYDKPANECKVCDANCISCTDATKCSVCANYYFVKTDKCSACPTNCKKCSAADTCTQCKASNFLFDKTSKSCKVCDKYCKKCATATTCEICKINSYMDTLQKPPKCQYCHSKISNCNVCKLDKNNVLLCYKCAKGYSFADDYKSCLPCSVGCKTCIDPFPVCKNCTKPYIVGFGGLYCGGMQCYNCDKAKGDNCTQGSGNYTLAGCDGDCMNIFGTNNQTVKKFCSKKKCNSLNLNKKYCKAVKGKTQCEYCCNKDKCNYNDAYSSSSIIKFSIIATIITIVAVFM